MGIRRLWILGALFGPAFLAGCSSKHVGVYEGNQPSPGAPAAFAGTVEKIHLELQSTGHFVYVRMGFPWEGEWAEENGRIKLIIDAAMNKQADPLGPLGPRVPILEPKSDGTLIVHDAFTPTEGVVLKKMPK